MIMMVVAVVVVECPRETAQSKLGIGSAIFF
jgi:hypothetical protein